MARHETEALWAFVSDELDAAARARVEEHLAGCEECTQKLAEVRQTRGLLHTAREDVPAVRWSEVDERLQVAAARKLARLERGPRWPWALVAAGAMAALVAFLVLRPEAVTPPQPGPSVAVREEPAPAVAPQEPPDAVVAREEPPAPVAPAPREEPAPPAPVVVATRVESATGAWIREAGAKERSLQSDTQLQAGASVRTRAKSNALLRLPDKSRVRLSPNSEVTLARTEAADVHLTVKRGRLAVQASHVARQGFTVEAKGVRATVVGTVFSVERTPRGVVIAVLEGKVQVETEGHLPRLIAAGERVEVRPGKSIPKVRALSSQDRQAFQELGRAPAEPAPALRPTTGGASLAREPLPAVATGPASGGPSSSQAPGTEPSAPTNAQPEAPPSPVAATPPSEAEESGSEFAPYPARTSPESSEAVALAPAPGTPDTQSPWAPPEPGMALPGTADARFLWHAREQLSAATCESFLVGLAEIAERSRVREFREQARYLRARCFEERLATVEAQEEFRRYLREFPKGRYVREAKAALLP
jgi:hypothetical protein